MKNQKAVTAAAAVGVALLAAGCATGPERKPDDPFEPTNRVIFKFNDKLDRTIAQPVARGYQKVTPQPLREAISSFFSNIGDVSSMANSLLQLKITEATGTLMRIVINTTFGVGGMFDVATIAGLPKHSEDFGLTLGRYGVPAGPYLVLPVFGPSSVRDGIGMGVDVKFNLLNYIEPAVRNPMYVTQFVSARSDMLGATDLLQQAALDPYSFVRDAFRQQRESRIRGTSGASAPLPDYGDPGEGGAHAPAATPGLPNYTDPGDSGSHAPAATPGLPDYTDPGETGGGAASGAGGGSPAAAGTAATEGAGAAAAAGTAGTAGAAVRAQPATGPGAAAQAPSSASAAAARAPVAASAPTAASAAARTRQ